MKNLVYMALSLMLLGAFHAPVYANESREETQAALDAACEAAREKKLAPIRSGYVEECVTNKEQASREACEKLYKHYGERMGKRVPLFYDLPECVRAFDFRQSATPD
ncbi:MAG: hypothetical protein WBS20_04635 [Lysobacterales bacterium]